MHKKAEVSEASSENLGEVLSKIEIELAKVKANSSSKKGRMELEVVKAKMELVEARKEVVEAMKRYRTSVDFVVEKTMAVVDFRKSEEFFVDRRVFS